MDEHLFRREAGRMVAALTRVFGLHNLALAEDVVQDALCRALEVWRIRGAPDNPAAWLMTTAKHRAIDVVRRERTAERFAHLVAVEPALEEAFAPHAIRDEQLRMMFTCCQPHLAEEVQLALVLTILCGFGAAEIASAFLASTAAVEKRIARGKQALAATPALFDLGAADLGERLAVVQRGLYLLFNEGYHGAGAEPRVELCDEAMRLVGLLREHPATATPATTALAAMMCLHAARLPARDGLVAFAHQDRARWDAERMATGLALLEASATGDALSTYHVEAAIAAVHASAPTVAATDWVTIVAMYDQLMALAPSPVIALNRAIAIGERDGAAAGLVALHAIADRDRLARYPFYPAALGELELRRGDRDAARRHFRAALAVARTAAERRFLAARLALDS